MISFLIGKIYRLSPLVVHLNVNGVGYRIYTTISVTEKLNARGKDEDVIFYTRVHYTETSQSIYGFLDEHEVDLFDFLISLHGIGPKIVMSILSYCDIDEFLKSLEKNQSEILTKVPGIGKTRAEKILFEAKSKQKKLENIIAQFSKDGSTKTAPDSGLMTSILTDSLETLGFNKKEMALAEKKIQVHESGLPPLDKDTIQLWIRTFLKYL
jgi:Holliday junction DNA helicase RuvA